MTRDERRELLIDLIYDLDAILWPNNRYPPGHVEKYYNARGRALWVLAILNVWKERSR